MKTKQTTKHNITDYTKYLKPRLYELSESLDSIICGEYYPQEYEYMPIDLTDYKSPMYKKMQYMFGTRILTPFFEAMLGNIDVGDIIETDDGDLGVVTEVISNCSGMPMCAKIKVSKEYCEDQNLDSQYINVSVLKIVFWDRWKDFEDTFKSDTYPWSLPDAEHISEADDIYDWINNKPNDESFEHYIDRYSFDKYFDDKYLVFDEEEQEYYYE